MSNIKTVSAKGVLVLGNEFDSDGELLFDWQDTSDNENYASFFLTGKQAKKLLKKLKRLVDTAEAEGVVYFG